MQRLGYRAELDGIRAFVAFGIMAFHDSLPLFHGGNSILAWFFVLSGFLITTLLLEEQHKYGNIDLGRFYIRRMLRLFPSLYLMLGTFWILSLFYVSIDGREFISAGLYFSNLHAIVFGPEARQVFLEHTWSLALEEHFYFIWPLLILLLKSVRSVLLFCFGAIALSFAVRFMHAADIWRSPWDIFPLFTLESFAVGGLLAYFIRDRRVVRAIDRPWVLWACLPIAWADIAFIITKTNMITPFRQILGCFVIGIILYHIVVHPERKLFAALRHPAIVYIGLLSYSIYLWHFPVFELLKEERQPGINKLLRHVLKFGLSIGLASLTYHLVEKPLLGMRQRLRSRTVAPASATAANSTDTAVR